MTFLFCTWITGVFTLLTLALSLCNRFFHDTLGFSLFLPHVTTFTLNKFYFITLLLAIISSYNFLLYTQTQIPWRALLACFFTTFFFSSFWRDDLRLIAHTGAFQLFRTESCPGCSRTRWWNSSGTFPSRDDLAAPLTLADVATKQRRLPVPVPSASHQQYQSTTHFRCDDGYWWPVTCSKSYFAERLLADVGSISTLRIGCSTAELLRVDVPEALRSGDDWTQKLQNGNAHWSAHTKWILPFKQNTKQLYCANSFRHLASDSCTWP